MEGLKQYDTETLKREIENRSWLHVCVDLMHAHFCSDDHNEVCFYYQERQLERVWELPYHAGWTQQTTDYLRDNSLDAHELYDIFMAVAPLLENFFKLTDAARKVFVEIIEVNK